MARRKKPAQKPHRSSVLCSACAKLDLSPGAHTPGIARLELKERRKVGRTSSCPLCRLVPTDSRDYEFRWSSKRGFYMGISGLSPYDTDRIVFVDEHCERPPPLCGRVIAPQADVELLKTWLRSCEHVHGAQCAPIPDVVYTPHSSPEGLKTFRVIDVGSMCIVDAEPGCRYLALSYCWGQTPSLSLLKENKRELMTPRALEPLHGKLPKTLRDAIHLTKLLGEKFLWVDRLCLVQDDPDDLRQGIPKMDLVYEGSVLCVIAAAGEDADGGLPGVHPGEREVTQHVEEIRPGLRLVKVTNLYPALGVTYYMKRGWTYQELMLPPRALIFLPSCIYWRCSRVVWSEDTAFDRAPLMRHKNTGSSAKIPFFRDKKLDPYTLYAKVISRYSLRALTKEADALDANAGLVNRIARTLGSDTEQGLLISHFDLCLLFYHPYIWAIERRAEFPTWTWAGWKGATGIWSPKFDNMSAGRWLATQRHIKWYRRDLRTGDVKLICEPSDGQSAATPDAPGETEEEENSSGDEVEVTDGYENKAQKKREPVRDGGTGPAPEELEATDENADDAWDARDGLPTDPTSIRWQDIPFSYPALQFWTWTVLLPRLEPTERGFGKIYSRAGLCGAVYFDDRRFGWDRGRHYEAALLSRADGCASLGENWLGMSAGRPVWWVLLIDWKADGLYAERKAAGFIYRDHVQHLVPDGRQWKEIVLV